MLFYVFLSKFLINLPNIHLFSISVPTSIEEIFVFLTLLPVMQRFFMQTFPILSPLKNTWLFLMNELLMLKKFILRERFPYIINIFNSNNSFIKKCQVFFNGLIVENFFYKLKILLIFKLPIFFM